MIEQGGLSSGMEARLCPDFLVDQETEENTIMDMSITGEFRGGRIMNERRQSGKGWGHLKLTNDPGH